jgi:hypothetical protein
MVIFIPAQSKPELLKNGDENSNESSGERLTSLTILPVQQL